MDQLIWLFVATVDDHRAGIAFAGAILLVLTVAINCILRDNHGHGVELPSWLKPATRCALAVGLSHLWLATWTPELHRVACLLQGVCR